MATDFVHSFNLTSVFVNFFVVGALGSSSIFDPFFFYMFTNEMYLLVLHEGMRTRIEKKKVFNFVSGSIL